MEREQEEFCPDCKNFHYGLYPCRKKKQEDKYPDLFDKVVEKIRKEIKKEGE